IRINEPRYPSLKGIMAAKKKEIKQMAVSELGLAPAEVGAAGARVAVQALAYPEAREVGQVLPADGRGGAIIAGYLAKIKIV
ncbi:MAG: hypothetical protein M0Z94_09585, partial [Dehalococcoidales bacterium]|nr:hypothetical protein [Dehalococcoidales bacterium]